MKIKKEMIENTAKKIDVENTTEDDQLKYLMAFKAKCQPRVWRKLIKRLKKKFPDKDFSALE